MFGLFPTISLGLPFGSGGGPLSVTYDTRYGTDSASTIIANSGWFTFGLNAGNRRVWVNNDGTGSDSNAGTSSAAPLATFDHAMTVFKTGFTPGDQLMIAGKTGVHYQDTAANNLVGCGGISATYPTAILSYDKTDATNTAKYGKLVGADMPIIDVTGSSPSFTIATGSDSYIAFQGFELNNVNNVSGMSWSIAGSNVPGAGRSDIVLQNFRLGAIHLNYEGNVSDVNNPYTSAVWHERGNISKGSFWGTWYAATGNDQGFFCDYTDGVWFQDLVFAHGGWSMGYSRDDSYTVGGTVALGHNYYYGATNKNGRFDRIIGFDPAADTHQIRGDTVGVTCLVAIDGGYMGSIGGFTNAGHYVEAPNGIRAYYDDILVMGGVNLNHTNSNPAGGCNTFTNTLSGSYVRKLVATDNPLKGQNSTNYFMAGQCDNNTGEVDAYLLIDQCVSYNYASYLQSFTSYPAKVHPNFTNCILDIAVPDGSGNITVSGSNNSIWNAGTFPNAINRGQLYSRMGFTSKPNAVNIMLGNPHLPWAQAAIGIGLPAFNITPTYPTASPPSLTGLYNRGVYREALGDVTLATSFSSSFTSGTPNTAGVHIQGLSANFTLSSTDTPGYTAGQTISSMLYNGSNAGATISSITYAGTTATLTTSTAHGLTTGATVIVSGATPSQYNGQYAITVTGPTTFTYTMGSSPGANASPVGSYTYYGVLVTTSAAHGLSTNNTVTLWACFPEMFNITGATVNVLSSTTFTFKPWVYPGSSPVTIGSYAKTPFYFSGSYICYDGTPATFTGFHIIENSTEGLGTHSTLINGSGAATLSSPTVSSPDPNHANLGVTTNMLGGSWYWVFTTSSTQPTGTQIVNGQDNTGAAAAFANSQSVTVSGAQTASQAALAPSQGPLYAWYVQNISGTLSNVVGAGPFTAETGWNPAASASTYSFSNNDLTATESTSSANNLVLGSVAKSSGAFQVTVTVGGTGSLMAVGLSDGSETSFLGASGKHSVGYFRDGRIFYNGSIASTVATYTTGDVIEVDWSGGQVTFKKNGTTVYGPWTPTPSGIVSSLYPSAYLNALNTGSVFVLNPTSW